MMKLACKDMDPNMMDGFEVQGETANEVAQKMMVHVKSNHLDVVKGMSDDEIIKMLEPKVHE